MKGIHCLYLVLCILIIIPIYYFIRIYFIKEAFADKMNDDAEIVTSSMTQLSEMICPSYEGVIESILEEKRISSPETNETKQREDAIRETVKGAGGALFPCPPPDDPLAVPVDISQRVERTAKYLLEKTNTILEKLTSALNCPPGLDTPQATLPQQVAGFQDICTEEQGILKEDLLREEALKEAAKKCKRPEDITEEDRRMILQIRKDALNTIMNNTELLEIIAKIKINTDQIRDVKARAETGELTGLCNRV
jgi:hypothetical protein